MKKFSAEKLTNRQKQVTTLLAAGYTTRQIAERLNLTERAVTYHISNVRRRLGVTSRSQLIAVLVLKRSRSKDGDID